MNDDLALTRSEPRQGVLDPRRSRQSVAPVDDDVLGRWSRVFEKILQLIGVAQTEDGVERLIGAREVGFHALDRGGWDLELVRDSAAVAVGHQPIGVFREPGAQPAKVEEQALLRRRRSDSNDRRIAQDVILNRGHDPPARVGREAHVALGIETLGGLHQAHIAFLHQIAEGKAVAAKARGDPHREPCVAANEFMQRFGIVVFAPAAGKVELAVALEKRRLHGRRDVAAIASADEISVGAEHDCRPFSGHWRSGAAR